MPSNVYGPTKDSSIRDDNPDINYGSNELMNVGFDDADKNDPVYRALLEFDISDLVGEAIDAASELKVFVYTIDGGQAFTCHRFTKVIVEGEVTWNKNHATSNWASPGGDFAAPTVAFTGPSSTGYQVILTGSGLAAFLQDAIDNRSGIVYMILKADDEATQNEWSFRAKEYLGGGQEAKLTVVYDVPAVAGVRRRSLGFI